MSVPGEIANPSHLWSDSAMEDGRLNGERHKLQDGLY